MDGGRLASASAGFGSPWAIIVAAEQQLEHQVTAAGIARINQCQAHAEARAPHVGRAARLVPDFGFVCDFANRGARAVGRAVEPQAVGRIAQIDRLALAVLEAVPDALMALTAGA